MSASLLIVVDLVCFLWALWVLFNIPQLLFRPAAIERLSTLRDCVYDARRAGEFSYKEECVAALLERIETVVAEGSDGSAWDWSSATQREAVAASSGGEGLDDSARALYLDFEDQLRAGANRLLFRGKWNGAIEARLARMDPSLR